MKRLVNVTQDHIDHGEPGSACSCPIALALRGLLPPDIKPYVGPYSIDYHRTKRHDASGLEYGEIEILPHAQTPKRATTFINRFDSGETVEPTTFFIDFPDTKGQDNG